jgi:ABC-2 type transport system ATP-binding protein
VDEDLTGRENLVLLGRLLGLKRDEAKARAAELLEAFGIADAAGRLVKTYSGGMRRRLDLAASIVVTPELMFLDEPTTGRRPRLGLDIVRASPAPGRPSCLHPVPGRGRPAGGRIAVIDHGTVIARTPASSGVDRARLAACG